MYAKVPVRVGGVGIHALPLNPLGNPFCLGSTAMDEIAVMTSTPGNEIYCIVDRLEELGALRQPWKSGTRHAAVSPPAAAVGASPEQLYDDYATPGYDLAELNHVADVDMVVRIRFANTSHPTGVHVSG